MKEEERLKLVANEISNAVKKADNLTEVLDQKADQFEVLQQSDNIDKLINENGHLKHRHMTIKNWATANPSLDSSIVIDLLNQPITTLTQPGHVSMTVIVDVDQPVDIFDMSARLQKVIKEFGTTGTVTVVRK